MVIAVDPFGSKGAAQTNISPLRAAIRWLQQGGLLVVFPAGTVSHLQVGRRRVTDPPWNASIGRIVAITRAAVLPIYFHGANSILFQTAGLLHPRLRTALLPRELLKKAHTTLQLQIGQPIPFAHLEHCGSDEAIVRYLRMRTYVLAELPVVPHAVAPPVAASRSAGAPIVGAIARGLLKAEVEALPAEQCLVESGHLSVHCARAQEIPWCLQEIGRLREVAFRAAGEGTGKASDVDLFDAYYLHLFVWDKQAEQIIGAYRLGCADEILARYSKRGLYTHSLFKYGRQVLERINPAIELGRSFVRVEHQRSFAPLMLLWRAIGAFVVRSPRYAVLFGPVSISNSYAPLSRQLLVDFLKTNSVESVLARHVRPRRPFRPRRFAAWGEFEHSGLKDIEDVSRLVAQIECDSKGAPILLKQYLKLGGRLLGFSADVNFNDALDGLIMVDLRVTDPRVLARYMGAEGAKAFLAYHGRLTWTARQASI
jgi:putative hemolysin